MSLNSEHERQVIKTTLVLGVGSLAIGGALLAGGGYMMWHELGYAGALAALALGVYFRYIMPGEPPSTIAVVLFSAVLAWMGVSIANPAEYPVGNLTARGVAAVLLFVLVCIVWYYGARSRNDYATILEGPADRLVALARGVGDGREDQRER
jgi:hypothetical protein